MSNKEAMAAVQTAWTNLQGVLAQIATYIDTLKAGDVSGNLTEMASQIEATTAQFQAILPQ